jgi:hypothetical protein
MPSVPGELAPSSYRVFIFLRGFPPAGWWPQVLPECPRAARLRGWVQLWYGVISTVQRVCNHRSERGDDDVLGLNVDSLLFAVLDHDEPRGRDGTANLALAKNFGCKSQTWTRVYTSSN